MPEKSTAEGFTRPPGFRFAFGGVNLLGPADNLPPNKYPAAQNIRSRNNPAAPGGQFVGPRPGYIPNFNSNAGNAITDIRAYSALGTDNTPRFLARDTADNIVLDNGNTVVTLSGNNGSGVCMIPFRPSASPQTWMYVASQSDYRKISAPGANNTVTVNHVGIIEPQTPVGAVPLYTNFNQLTFPANNWTQGGTATSLPGDVNRTTDTAGVVIEDPLGNYRFSIQVANNVQYQVGELLVFNNTVPVPVAAVIPPIGSVTIQSIYYYAGNNGNCTIVPSQLPIGEGPTAPTVLGFLQRGALVTIGGNGSETVFVQSVTQGPGPLISFETNTANTHAANATITGVPTIIAAPINVNISSNQSISCAGVSYPATQGISYMSLNISANNNPFTSLLGGGAAQDDDYIHVSLNVSDPTQVIEMQLQFNVDATDTTYSENYYYYAIDPSILSQVVVGTLTQTAALNQTQNELSSVNEAIAALESSLNNPDTNPAALPTIQQQLASYQAQLNSLSTQSGSAPASTSGQTVAGSFQWTEIYIPISALTRIGNDQTRTLANCNGFRIWANTGENAASAWQAGHVYISGQEIVDTGGYVQKVTTPGTSGATYPTFNETPTGTTTDNTVTWTNEGLYSTYGAFSCTIEVSSIWIGGGGQPDVGDNGSPYNYQIKPRSSITGATGNPSPPMRYGVSPRRQSVTLTLPGRSTTEYDLWDVYRYGGSVTSTRYIGTAPAGNNTSNYVDNVFDDTAQAGQPISNSDFQPWPAVDLPFVSNNGTVAVHGTSIVVTDNNATWPSTVTNWLPGTLVTVGANQTYTLWDRPVSAGNNSYWFQIVECAGFANNASQFWVKEPIAGNQSAPYMWGPDAYGTVFAVGLQLQPGVVSWAAAYTPDSVPQTNTLELCPPSEPLIGGECLQGITMIASTKRWWSLYPAFTGSGYTALEQAVGKPLLSPYAKCTDGLQIYFWAKDGIYSTNGGAAVSLTDADLYPLFPHEGASGANVTNNGVTFYAPDYSRASSFRLAIGNEYLFADYQDTTGTYRTLVMDRRTMGWETDSYAGGTTHMLCHYQPEQQAGSIITPGTLYPALVMGDTAGNVWQEQDFHNDNTAGISCVIGTFEWDGGDQRAQPQWGDEYIDCLPGAALTVTPTSQGVAIAGVTATAIHAGPRTFTTVSLGGQTLQKYLGMQINWTQNYPSNGPTYLYLWQPSFLSMPEIENDRYHDWDNVGTDRPKYFTGFRLECDTFNAIKQMGIRSGDNLILEPFQSAATLPSGQIQHNGQTAKSYAFTSPFTSHLLRIEPQDPLPWRFWNIEWVCEPWPSNTLEESFWLKVRGDSGASFLQGFVVPMEAGGNTPIIKVVTDRGQSVILTATVTPQATVKTAVPFSLPTPFVCHEVQIIPQVNCRTWYDEIEWIAQPTPELAQTWTAQLSGLGISGYLHIPRIQAAWASTVPVTVGFANYDGQAPLSITLPSTGGAYQKAIFSLTPNKGMLYSMSATSAAVFQIFEKDWIVWAGAWGRQDAYTQFRNLGGQLGDAATI